MSTITTAAGAVDTAVATLASTVATLVTDILASQTTYQAANPNRYQQGMVNFEDNIRAAILSTPQLAAIMKLPPQNPASPALATQYAAF